MSAKIMGYLQVIAVVVTLALLLSLIAFIIHFNTFRDITREHRDLINQMRATEHGHLIRRARMDMIGGDIYINIYIRSSAQDKEVFALANEIKPLIDERFLTTVDLRLRVNAHNPLYRFYRSRSEWTQTYPRE